jgi:CPA2 family monovalent cation:H+ antiporter-2
LYDFFVPANSFLVGKTIRETGLREKANALVVGVGRNHERLLNPESDFCLQANDILFVVGNRKKLKTMHAAFEHSEYVKL